MSARLSASTKTALRSYFYTLDVHGQLFLADTKIRNFTSNLKDRAFLDFFYSRIRINDQTGEGEAHRRDGYAFVSPCGQEMNWIKADDSVLVYQKLTAKGLTYAGSYHHPFDPTSLRVDPSSGYLYHPSPPPPLRKQQRTGSDLSQYGPYSLLRSSLVLDAFAESLELDDDERTGSFEWTGKRYKICRLEEGMVIKSALSP